MSDKLWRAVYDRFHKPQTDPEKKKENVERYHALVKMMVAIERQNLLQIAEDKNFLNSDADLDSFIDGLETALIISMLPLQGWYPPDQVQAHQRYLPQRNAPSLRTEV